MYIPKLNGTSLSGYVHDTIFMKILSVFISTGNMNNRKCLISSIVEDSFLKIPGAGFGCGWLPKFSQSLANVNSRLRSLCVIASPFVCRLSVTFVHPTKAIEIFGTVSTPFGRLRWPSVDIQVQFYGDRPRGTPPSRHENIAIFDLSNAISRKRCKIEAMFV